MHHIFLKLIELGLGPLMWILILTKHDIILAHAHKRTRISIEKFMNMITKTTI